MNTKQKGDISEGQVLAAFLKNGLNVLVPFGDRNRYDFVVECSDRFIRVQVKTGRLTRNSVRFNAYSTTTENGRWKMVSYKGQIDLFAVYSPDLDKIFVVPPEKCRERDTCLSITGRSRNGHVMLMASDFEWSRSSDLGRAIGR